jgi:diguanylate cyclase (GGDEF)-like protein
LFEFVQQRQRLALTPQIGLLERIWLSKQTAWIEDINKENDPLFEYCSYALTAGLKAALGIPIISNHQVLAVLVFFQKDQSKPSQRSLELVDAITTQLGFMIQWKKAEADLKQANLKLQRLATLDGLTQVANRRRFDEYLAQEWKRLLREQHPVSLILCDVDYFKQFNDHYGHQMGDECLQKVAQIMSQTIKRPADLVARYGGEEFAIIIPNTDAEGALMIAMMIQSEIKKLQIPHTKSTVSRYVTLSFGVASVIPDQAFSPENLIAKADEALYEAKQKGRDRVIIKSLTQGYFQNQTQSGFR